MEEIVPNNYKNLYNKSVIDRNNQNNRYKLYREEWEENPKKCRASQFPLNVDIELTNACNLKCPHCARTTASWGNGNVGFMDKELAKKIIDEVNNEGGYSLKFSLRGEPLLYKDIVEICEYAKQKENIVDFYFNTNGVGLSEKLAREFVRIQLPRISISVGGWDKESFEKCQVGAKYETVRNNIIRLKEIREAAKSEYPKIRVQVVLKDEVKQHMNEFVELWKDCADELSGIDFRDESANKAELGKTDEVSFKCNCLWQRVAVLWNGEAYPCLFQGVTNTEDICLGNVKETSIKEMWNSKKLEDIRNKHALNKSYEVSSCRQCSYRISETQKLGEKI